MSSSLTQKWLRQAVNSYPNQQRVYADVDATLARFSALRPKSDVYTFDDGRTQLLLCVHGLLPITFRGASYNIQMAIWVTRDYPRQPPIAYVVPTNDILVRPGKYVDVSGRCNIEYLQHWERKAEGCSLSALLEAFQDYFSLEPPVYSKPKDVVSSYANRPPPPLPSQSQSQSQLPPPLPSKPPIGQRYPPPHIGSGREIQSSHVDSPPPVPPPPALPQNTTQPQIASPPYVVSPSPQSASDYPPRT